MAATIARSLSRVNCLNYSLKQLKICSPIPSKNQNCAIYKDVYRCAWYRSFFRSDQSTNSNEDSNDTAASAGDGTSMPRRPPNVFVLYLKNVQDDIKQANPDFKRPEIVTEAAKRWKELDPEYKSKIAMDRKEMFDKYKMDKINYLENMTPEQIKMEEKEKGKKAVRKLRLARKHLGIPDRPWSSYKYFLSEKFGERSDESIQTYFKQAKDRWNELPEHERAVYHKKHKESQQRYQDEMADWEESMIEAGRFDVLRKMTMDKLRKAESRKRESKNKNKVIEKSTRTSK